MCFLEGICLKWHMEVDGEEGGGRFGVNIVNGFLKLLWWQYDASYEGEAVHLRRIYRH